MVEQRGKIGSSRTDFVFRAVAAGMLLCLFLAGCGPKPKPQPIQERRPLTEGELISILQDNKEGLRSIKAKVAVKVRTPETRGDQFLEEGLIAIAKPDRMRLRAEKLFAARLELVSDGRIFWVYVKTPEDEKVYTGTVNSRVEESALPLSPKLLIEAMGFSEIAIGGDEEYVIEDQYGEYVVTILQRGEKLVPLKKVRISAYDWNISSIDYFEPDGKIFARVSLTHYRLEQGFNLPHTVEVSWPFSDSSLRLTFKKYTLNEVLSDKLWEFKPPRGVEPEWISDPPLLPKMP